MFTVIVIVVLFALAAYVEDCVERRNKYLKRRGLK